MASRGLRVIVLAAQRKGVTDPLATRFNVSHKCLVPLGGRPLIAHVVETVAGYSCVEDVVISVEPDAFAAIGRALPPGNLGEAPIRCVAAAASIADSVLAAAAGHSGPLLVTTADHALMTRVSLDAMVEALRDHEVAIAMARREAVLAAHPEGQRRFYSFRDGEYSNCNLYAMAHPGALRAARVFRGGGQFAKKASRIIGAFGLLNLLLLRMRVVGLPLGMRRVSRRLGLDVVPVILADGSQAIDVDNDRTYAIVAQLLERRPGATKPVLPERSGEVVRNRFALAAGS